MGILDFLKPDVDKLRLARDVDGLMKAIDHKDPTSRAEAARALGEIGDPRALRILVLQAGMPRAGQPGQEDVWPAAIEAIRHIGVQGVPSLLADSDRDVREGAVMMLALGLGDVEAVEPLMAILDDRDEEPRVRIGAATALARIGDPRAADAVAAFFIEFLTSPQAQVIVRMHLQQAEGDETRKLELALQLVNGFFKGPLVAVIAFGSGVVDHLSSALGVSTDWFTSTAINVALQEIAKPEAERSLSLSPPLAPPANAPGVIGATESPRAEAPSESDLESSIRGLMQRHLERLGSERGSVKGVPELCDQLLTDRLLSVAVSAVAKLLPGVLAGSTPSSSSNMTADWLVAVTVCPALLPEDVRGTFPNGYLALLDELAKPGLTQPEGRYVAHWIYCTKGDPQAAAVHLTLIPNSRVSAASAILATDLMTPTERQQVGM